MKRQVTAQSRFFNYNENKLFVEYLPVEDIVKKYGTPIFILSENEMQERYERFVKAFSYLKKMRVHYAVKANANLDVIRVIRNFGAGMDVNSEGELFRVKKVGVKSKDIIMSGVGKTNRDIVAAIRAGIKMIKVESISELYRIESVASQLKKVAKVGLRVNPDVKAETHQYVATGGSEQKFGIEPEIIKKESIRFFRKSKWTSFVGLEMHIGSQIFDPMSYQQAAGCIIELAAELSRNNRFSLKSKSIDLGGGFGIKYTEKNPQTQIEDFAETLKPLLKKLEAEILFEPGRYLVGNAGVLATEVLYLKETLSKKKFVVVDAAMTELIRPSLYLAEHEILPVRRRKAKNESVDVVGPVCETGDFFAKDRSMQVPKEGDLLAIMSSGAYSSVMSSNYNARRKPAEVLVSKNKVKLIHKRQTLNQLIQNENI